MISTVIVTKNDRLRISRTLKSMTNQLMIPRDQWEVVIIDGGDDNLEEFLGKFEQLPIKYHLSVDSGIYDAMNAGVCVSSHDFVHFLNCGDLLHDDLTIARTIQEIGDAAFDLYFWDFYIIGDSNPTEIRNVTTLSILNYKNSYCHQAQIIRRRFLLHDKYSLDLKFCADYLATLKILSVGRTRSLNFVGVHYEQGGFSDDHFSEIVAEKRRAFREFVRYRRAIHLNVGFIEFLMGTVWNLNPLTTKILHRMFR